MANYNNGVLAVQSSQTINSGGISGAVSLSSIDDFLMDTKHVKKYQVLEIDEDLLALSTTWKRLRDEHKAGGPYSSISRLIEPALFTKVTEADRERANVIRDYYSKKIMVLKLKNIGFSAFREDLNSFIHTNGKMFKETMMPMVYCLPEFYEYDTKFEEMSRGYNREIKREHDNGSPETKDLKFINKLSVNTRRIKTHEYWFGDEFNNLVQLTIDNSNPLSSLMDKVVSNEIKIKGFYRKQLRDGNEFLKAEKYTFL